MTLGWLLDTGSALAQILRNPMCHCSAVKGRKEGSWASTWTHLLLDPAVLPSSGCLLSSRWTQELAEFPYCFHDLGSEESYFKKSTMLVIIFLDLGECKIKINTEGSGSRDWNYHTGTKHTSMLVATSLHLARLSFSDTWHTLGELWSSVIHFSGSSCYFKWNFV